MTLINKISKQEKQRKLDDVVIRESDIIVVVMGITGTGKSTFINTIAESPILSVGHGLDPHTLDIQCITIPYPKDPTRRVVLVDTPGLDNYTASDLEILTRIANWLNKFCVKGAKIAGIIYLHEICQARELGAAQKNLDAFHRFCNDQRTKNVILATTKWASITKDIEERRERDLASPKHWQHMLQQGSKMCRFDGTRDSAWDAINLILADN